VSTKFLGPAQVEFAQHPGGLLDMTLEGQVIEGVQCVPLFPLSDPHRFISIVKPSSPNPEEIGILEELSELRDDQRRLVEAHIAFRYFVPEIEEIQSIEQVAGLYELRVVTERGPRTLFILNPRESVSITEPGVVVITDVERCRYKITHLDALSPKSHRELERVLL
jgi:hypothetical protein